MEWNSSLLITFIDYEKAFDSVDRRVLWRLLEHYGIPPKIINLIKAMYDETTCRIVHGGTLTECFKVETGVRQGCLLSPFFFLLAIDWIMKTTTQGKRNGIQWTIWNQLEDLDFADDVALLAHSHTQMQDKILTLNRNSAKLGLHINLEKTKIMKCNNTCNNPVKIEGVPIEEVDHFTYLGSIVDKGGGTERDVKQRIIKARTAFIQLNKIWAAKNIKTTTKLRLFNTNVKSVLLYGSETWVMNNAVKQKIQSFVNNCMRRILNIKWYDKIRNEDVWERTEQEPMEQQIMNRKWRWIGHTLRKPDSSITRQALSWNPQGKRKQGRPRNTWRRETMEVLNCIGLTWKEIERKSKNREEWRDLVCGLCSYGAKGFD